MTPIEYRDIGFTQLFFFENYVISQVKKDVVLDDDCNSDLVEAVENYFDGKPYIYIANRIVPYNVSPMTYMKTSKLDNLKGVCIVTKNESNQRTARYEGTFYTKSFNVCSELEDGIEWALSILRDVSQKDQVQSS